MGFHSAFKGLKSPQVVFKISEGTFKRLSTFYWHIHFTKRPCQWWINNCKTLRQDS